MRYLTVFAGIIWLAVAGCSKDPAGEIPANAVIDLPDLFTGEYELIDTNGETVSQAAFTGKTPVIYFGFASCPDVCPLALGTLSAALNELNEREMASIVPIFITVDPDRDTPEALEAYLSFDDRLIGLTGDQAAIDNAKSSFKVGATKEALPDSASGYTMQHTSLFYIVSKSGQPKYAVRDSVTPAQLANILRRSIK